MGNIQLNYKKESIASVAVGMFRQLAPVRIQNK